MCTDTRLMDAAPTSPSLGNVLGKLLWSTPGGIRGKGQIKKRSSWYATKSIWDAIRSTSAVSPPHLDGRTRRDKFGACVGKGQTKSDQGRKALVESLSTPPSRAGRNASSGKKPRLWIPLLSLLEMGANHFRTTPLTYIFKKLGQVWSPVYFFIYFY